MELGAIPRGQELEEEGKGNEQGDGSKQISLERVPRGRCLPPIPPEPDPRRGQLMQQDRERQSASSRAERRQSHIVVMSEGRTANSRKPMPKWKRGYVGFKRKVNSSALVPLLLLVAVCGVGVHIVGLAGASLGYFTWSVGCEGVVTVAEESGRANGEQTYSIGWARYEGKGPSTASELGTLDGNTTVEADFGLGGVAGSSIPQKDWLASIDGASAALGSLTAIGHLLGCVFHSLVLFAFLRLFQSQFRSNRLLFRPASKASGALLVWLVGFGGAGFYSTAEENFKEQILSTLHGEGFLCENNDTVRGEFAYIATGFGCVASALMLMLTWRFGQAADYALADRFERKASLAGILP